MHASCRSASSVHACAQGGVVAFFTVYLAWAFYTDPPSNYRAQPPTPPHLEVAKVRVVRVRVRHTIVDEDRRQIIDPHARDQPCAQVLPDGTRLMKDGSIQKASA